ncbi:MAG: hypothetical protein QOI55_1425 [Actinomycetota bacterium]|jgi:SAM-dependent methyltransferase|nr:hypothetical protein [Actinomycetota bacterium]
MVERNSGVRGLLARPSLYELFQRAIGASGVRRLFVDRYVRVQPGERVLDVGCGTGELFNWLPEVEYVGFDPNERYIASARARGLGNRAQFHVGAVERINAAELGRFDRVIAQGVLHHLDDAAAQRLVEIAAAVLDADGRLVTFDPCFSPHQSRWSRALVARDRGANVRTSDAYRALAAREFDDVLVHEHHDLIRIPYSHTVLEAAGARIPGRVPDAPTTTP